MTPEQFQKAISVLGLDLLGAAALLGVHKRTIRRWEYGEREVPPPAANFLRYLMKKSISGEKAMDVLGISN
jgi:DNA-binding transcriptional regulator YiaG